MPGPAGKRWPPAEPGTPVVTKLYRLARSLPEPATSPTNSRGRVKLNLGGSLYNPTNVVGRLLFDKLAMVSELDLIPMRTPQGMGCRHGQGPARGKQPKLKPRQEANLAELYRAGGHTTAELAELFGITRSTITGLSDGPVSPSPNR